MYIISTSSELNRVKDAHIALEEKLQQLCKGKIRRVDRYIQLSLIGALSCHSMVSNPPALGGIILTTGCGTVSTSIKILDTILGESNLPKPFHFVNSLGNSACYFLSKFLHTSAPSVALSNGQHSFETGLIHALTTPLAENDSILIGGIDEAPTPIADQLKRLDSSDEKNAIYEGSHWLLLTHSRPGGNAIKLETPVYAQSKEKLISLLSSTQTSDIYLTNTRNLLAGLIAKEKIISEPAEKTQTHDTYSGHNFYQAYQHMTSPETSCRSATIVSKYRSDDQYYITRISKTDL